MSADTVEFAVERIRIWWYAEGVLEMLLGTQMRYLFVFPTVHHDTLQQIIGRAIRDTWVLHLISSIISAHESTDQDGRGIPIGTLTSPLFANI
jgi:hypothetical protein